MSALRAELKTWIDRARTGEEVVVTDRGIPVARLSGLDGADLVAGLLRDGLLTAPEHERPVATTPDGEHPARGQNAVSGLVRRLRR
ncbi:prevent-host-death family protein [Luteimicrobium subarcticum]|uniref:Prevent-host-death family protein n=1 Tax=Luteimicrobium subarcticum TaxID=620910 RepID=A0A2M8WVZ5_9MICO|nr:prevent-host-death family protein [Luteimicrobium subarcticum]